MPVFNNGYYQPYPYQQYPQYQQAQQVQPQIQNGGIVSVRSYSEVENWPMAPGNSMTFLIESNPPIVCTKTKGFSQLEPPTIEAFDLVRRNAPKQPQTAQKATEQPQAGDLSAYALKSDCEALQAALSKRIDELAAQLDGMKGEEHE